MKTAAFVFVIFIVIALLYIFVVNRQKKAVIRVAALEGVENIDNPEDIYQHLRSLLADENINDVLVLGYNGSETDTVFDVSEEDILGTPDYFYDEVVAAVDSYINFPDKIFRPASEIFSEFIKNKDSGEEDIDVLIGDIDVLEIMKPTKIGTSPHSLIITDFGKISTFGSEKLKRYYKKVIKVDAALKETGLPDKKEKVDIVILSPFTPEEAEKLSAQAMANTGRNISLRILSANHINQQFYDADRQSFDFFLAASLTNTDKAKLDDICRLFNKVAESCLGDSISPMKIFIFGMLPEARDKESPSLICMKQFTQKIEQINGRKNIDFYTYIFSGDREFPLDQDFYKLLVNNNIKLTKLTI